MAISARRGRGRPKDADGQRNRLLQAAEYLLASSGSDLNLRQVAQRAEVTAPLAHYYFGNRDGLLRALMEERANPRVDELLAAARELSAQPVVALTRLMHRLTSLIANDGFVRCCLLLPAGEPLRDRLRSPMRELLREAQATGLLRADLSASYLADTLLGLCVFPFLGTSQEANSGERAAPLTLQNVALLQDGIVRTQRPRQDSGS
jgi:TetR/AcrR family transcriptional regulator